MSTHPATPVTAVATYIAQYQARANIAAARAALARARAHLIGAKTALSARRPSGQPDSTGGVL
jgi:hypothetical protein